MNPTKEQILMKRNWIAVMSTLAISFFLANGAWSEGFQGGFFAGEGDREYLELLDVSRRMLEPDPVFQNLAMLYEPSWNGLVEGPTWDAWWIQNSYGTTYSVLPYLQEPYLTFLQNSHDLWFDQMGDGKTMRPFKDFRWIPPDGCLCDAARPGYFIAKQGDGRVEIHDWGIEFTAAGLLLQSELLLINRDRAVIDRYLPKLERCADFLETRRDISNNRMLGGPASNLLAPSYAGYKKEDGTYGQAYLCGLSVTTIAALNRLIELEKLAERKSQAERYARRRDLLQIGLSDFLTEEEYFVKSIDPDGTRHGVFGAEKHGYFEASPNHDALAFRVADDEQSHKIFRKIESLSGLRPHSLIIANYPGLDDMYVDPTGNWLWSFGTWVNGGHWSTCEARMILGYSRLGKYEDIRRSIQQMMTFARQFRLDNPLVEFGSKVYQPNQPVNLCYDSFGPMMAMIRGLFEYIYTEEGLTLYPHIPPGIEKFEQKFPVRLGKKQIFLSTQGSGDIRAVWMNGKAWPLFDDHSISLLYHRIPDQARIQIALGKFFDPKPTTEHEISKSSNAFTAQPVPEDNQLKTERAALLEMYRVLCEQQMENSYEAAHCRLGIECIDAIHERRALKLPPLPEPSQTAADQSYVTTAMKVYEGFIQLMSRYAKSNDAQKQQICARWNEATERIKSAK